MDKRREQMCEFRDYGIWVVAILLVANFFLWNNHDNQVRNEVKPAIKRNSELIDSNTVLLMEYNRKFDSVVKLADSVFDEVDKHHRYETQHDAQHK